MHRVPEELALVKWLGYERGREVPAHTLFGEPMTQQLFIRVPAAIYRRCEQAGRRVGKKPGTIARELLARGLEVVESGEDITPQVARAPFDKNFNLWITDDQARRIDVVLRREEKRLGQEFERGAFARRLMLIGMSAPVKTDGDGDGADGAAA